MMVVGVGVGGVVLDFFCVGVFAMKARTGWERGRHLYPRLVHKMVVKVMQTK